jgi:hypothetical protein
MSKDEVRYMLFSAAAHILDQSSVFLEAANA